MRNALRWTVIWLPVLALFFACGANSDGDGPPDDTPLLTGQWTWISGAGTGESPAAHYGTKGVPDPANVPGPRPGSSSWIDAAGKLWLFGGGERVTYYEGSLNDLWQFDPATNEWTWMSGSDVVNQTGVYGTKGVADPANMPGARYGAAAWIDRDGKFWLFGGQGVGWTDLFNDLWRFDPATLEWTWMSGSDALNQPGVYGTKGVADPANVPGARCCVASWIDSAGKLWLFGGETAYRGRANDLWRFDPATLEWTWISGTDIMNHGGVYGTKGVADAANIPTARQGAASWIDAAGKFWLFGGDSVFISSVNYHNDLWRFDPVTLEWTWISGSSDSGADGSYGRKGVAGPGSGPGARFGATPWIDANGKLWLFGGERGNLDFNDLWEFDPATGYWTWVSGNSSGNQAGVYGTKGVPAPANVPGARHRSAPWIDSSGRLWLFGGRGATYYVGSYNDLWHFTVARTS